VTPPLRLLATLLICAAGFSGAACLAYELLWSRVLVVVLGNATDATAVVLTGFMLGMAAGAFFGGRVRATGTKALRLYALLEATLLLYALVAPQLLSTLSAIKAHGTLPSGVVVRFVVAEVLVVIPCLLMGAALPLLISALVRPNDALGRVIGVIYGANTLGAAFGAVATGFFGIAWVGVIGTSRWAALASGMAGLLAFLASQKWPNQHDVRQEPAPTELPNSSHVSMAFLLTTTSGFVLMAAEVIWARILTFVFGHDGYAFAVLLAVVLVGLGIGGVIHRLLVRVCPLKLGALLLGLQGFTLLASFLACGWLIVHAGRDPFMLDSSARFVGSLWAELGRELLFTPILTLLPAVIAGVAFPCACTLARGSGRPARCVGLVTLVNGFGSAVGALAFSLGGISLLGVSGSFLMLALLCAFGAAIMSYRAALGWGRWRRVAVAMCAPLLLVVGAPFFPTDLPKRMLLQVVGPRHQKLLFYDEARIATISVISNGINQERQLLVNAVNEVTTRLVHDQSFKLLGQLGPLLHPKPERAIMICLGAGLSAGSALTHPLTTLDVVDLSAKVSSGARLFAEENNHVLDDPRLRLHIGDGRQFLLNTADHYDVAIVDSTHPKSVDSWILYTREFYQLLRERLARDAIVVQWLPLHGLSEREFKIVVATFRSVFPKMTLWANAGYETYGQVAYAKLVSRREGPLRIEVKRLEERLKLPAVREDLERYGMATVPEVLDAFIADWSVLEEWTRGLPIQTDDHPMLPYLTSYSRGRRMTPELLLPIHSSIHPLLITANTSPQVLERVEHNSHAQSLVLAGQLDQAIRLYPESTKLPLYAEQVDTSLSYYQTLAGLYRDDSERTFEAATQLGMLGYREEATTLFEELLMRHPDDLRARINFGWLMIARGQPSRAAQQFVLAHRQANSNPLPLRGLAAAAMTSGDPGTALRHARAALELDREDPATLLSLGQAALRTDDIRTARSAVEHAARLEPWMDEPHSLLGRIALAENRGGDAALEFRQALRLQPHNPEVALALGQALLEQSQREPAAAALCAAARLGAEASVVAQMLARTGESAQICEGGRLSR
jgi:spermidine synthase